jgi:hypothetical protein
MAKNPAVDGINSRKEGREARRSEDRIEIA